MKINILIICGSLEPGCDGVGDYSRRLAGELSRQGHFVALLALYDPYILKQINEEQETEGVQVPVLRLPYKIANHKRFLLAKEFVILRKPGWISLQFVPYAFQKKGLPYGLAVKLAALGGGRKWHVMFHELWVGDENLKNQVISLLQRALIKQLLRRLKPEVVHTHLPIYFDQLKGLGQTVEQLPLFSNIPTEDNPVQKNQKYFTVGFFSQATASKEILFFLSSINSQLIESGREIQILFIGGSVEKMKKIGSIVEQQPALKGKVHYTGYLSSKEVSSYLKLCDLGITSLPLNTLGKSGSVAAFFTHRIPVAVTDVIDDTYLESYPPFFNTEISKALLFEPDLSKLQDAKNGTILASKYSNLHCITKKFLMDLTELSI